MSARVLQILRTVEIEMDKEGSEFEDWQQCLQAHRCFHQRAINDDIDPIAPDREPDELLPGANGPDVSVPIRYEPIILAMDEVAIKKQLEYDDNGGAPSFIGDVNVLSVLRRDGFDLLDYHYDKEKLEASFQEQMTASAQHTRLLLDRPGSF
jgi:hypothetical protein